MQGSSQLGCLSDDGYARVASFALVKYCMNKNDFLLHLLHIIIFKIRLFFKLAAIASGFPTGFLLEKVGRKGTIMFMSVPFVTGWLMIAFAMNLTMVDVGRILTGRTEILQR